MTGFAAGRVHENGSVISHGFHHFLRCCINAYEKMIASGIAPATRVPDEKVTGLKHGDAEGVLRRSSGVGLPVALAATRRTGHREKGRTQEHVGVASCQRRIRP
jgi:hypothetical protein